MLTLYDYLPSQNAWKVRLLLNHLDRPYHQEFVSIFEGEGHKADYLAINPAGAVPAVRLDDGTTIAESNAILVYLAAGTDYFPACSREQAAVFQWLFFEADYVQSSVATLRHWCLTGKDESRTSESLQSKAVASSRVLSVLDRWLENNLFLAGGHYTIADMSVFAYTHLSEDAGISLVDFPHVMRWVAQVQEQPRFLDVVHPYSIDPFSFREL